MNKISFLEYARKKYTSKSSYSRLYRAIKVEKIIGTDLDEIVNDDERMFVALQSIDTGNIRTDNTLKNSLRNYYEYKNGKSFLREREYIKKGK